MKSILKERLRFYIGLNNPDLLIQLQNDYSLTDYLEDKVKAVMPLMEELIAEGASGNSIEVLCFEALTADLRPSKFNYLKTLLEEEFPEDYQRMVNARVLISEVINLIQSCKALFETFAFSEENEDDHFLRHALIAEIHDYLV